MDLKDRVQLPSTSDGIDQAIGAGAKRSAASIGQIISYESIECIHLGGIQAEELTHAEKLQWIGMKDSVARLFRGKRIRI